MEPTTIYLRSSSGATHALSGRRLKKLLAELKAGRGGPELTAMVMNGYDEFFTVNKNGSIDGTVDSMTYELLTGGA